MRVVPSLGIVIWSISMARVKNWMMEMEETVNDAVASDCFNIEDVIQYCNENLTYVEEDYVREYYKREIEP
ncbi:uncharacterized protein METZ01_LOCUS121652 [marine metagenome]|uniref:Uncharacterized protein n=1 Tax=marine metagenome TaxID=408172 RepID=A0A381XVP6_9ZZZZ